MNHHLRSCLLLLLSLSFTVHAAPIANGNYWQCSTYDKTNKQWSAVNVYQKVAMNFAFASCKKESTIPATCKTTRENCEEFVQGASIKPMWTCTAFDAQAMPWRSNTYSQRDDAAFAAKAYCRQNSNVPGTCYLNFITCANQNRLGL